MRSSALNTTIALRMRPDLAVQPLWLQGRRWWGLKDPLSLRYYQLRDEEFALLRLLDGRATLESVRECFERQFAPQRLEPRQFQSFLGMLHGEGLVVAHAPGQGSELLQRRGRLQRRERLQAAGNLLALRFRGVDPQTFLDWLYPKCRFVFRPWFLAACLLLAFTALALAAVRIDEWPGRLPDFYEFFTAGNIFWLALALMATKVLHELGHALTARHFGGEVHELGLMFLVFTPCLYCNVSDAWMLPNKWQRAAIAAAGIFVELVLASACTLAWWYSQPGVLHSLCLNVMFVCSAGTLLFNGNPLLRYDGYYILSDLLEVPNLQQQSGAVLKRLLGDWFLGESPADDRMLPDKHARLLAAYAAASIAYRWFVVGAVLWFLTQALKPYRLELAGRTAAVLIVGGMLAGPLWRLVQFARSAPRTPARSRRPWVRGLAVAAGVALLLFVPLPHRIKAPAIFEPQDAVRVYVSSPGTLLTALRPGQRVKQGHPLARLRNREVEAEIAQLQAQRDRQATHLKSLQRRETSDPKAAAEIPAAVELLTGLQATLDQRKEDRKRLTLAAPVDGVVLAPERQSATAENDKLPTWSGTPLDEFNRGSYLETGTLLCLVGEPDRLEAVLVVDQAETESVRVGQRVALQPEQSPGKVLWGTISTVSEGGLETAPRRLALQGELAVRQDRSGVKRPLRASYQARVSLDPRQTTLVAGGAAQARIHSAWRCLAARGYRWLLQTFRFDL